MIEGRTAVITGGGRGIGEAIARALAQAGVAVVVASRSTDRIDAVAAALRAAGHEAHALPCDVTQEASVEALFNGATERLGSIDILVNNAGAAHSSPLKRTTLEDWRHILDVNATGTFLCTRAFLPHMIERGHGRIVNIASVAGLSATRYIAAYAAAKHAVVGLTRAAAAEAAAAGVTVNAVCPAYVDTDMTRESVDRIVRTTGRSHEDALRAIIGTLPQQRLIQPSEVAHAVLGLCDFEACGVNGQCIVIDGGALLR
jgi:3-hydroxybutyrate dehydrogenase